jgi:hypothetical protein
VALPSYQPVNLSVILLLCCLYLFLTDPNRQMQRLVPLPAQQFTHL